MILCQFDHQEHIVVHTFGENAIDGGSCHVSLGLAM